MTDEKIEKALENMLEIDLTDEANYDSCRRLIIPKYYDTIHKTIDYIQRLKAENESKENCTIEQHAEIHRLRDEVKGIMAANERFVSNMEAVFEIEKEQIREDTAKEILQEFIVYAKEQIRGEDDYSFAFRSMLDALYLKAAELGVEVANE